ncbi:hypothetical protein [Actinoplanes awajinensis]|uniref:hypothetical protein n=1 Tax=Actinoplanes awajinensis TaxID=135946 RepID=UPI0012F8828D|nr:hypothetical protein [Actinoplanes awajinensis]
MTIVLARHGFYADRRDEVTTIVQTTPQRRLVEITSGHNIVRTHPPELTAALTAMTA